MVPGTGVEAKLSLQRPVAFDKEEDGWSGMEVLEHCLRVSAEATNDHRVTNSLVDHLDVSCRPPWSAA
jgi:hypothetical protein